MSRRVSSWLPTGLERREALIVQNRITIEVEATGGTSVAPGDRVRRGHDLGTSPDFRGRVTCPVDGVVEACRFNPSTHRFEIIIIPKSGEKG